MASSDTPRLNVWTRDELKDLVMAWELAISRPRDSPTQTLHDAVYKQFVALRGGSTRRNKAALTSKRSVLKLSYLLMREFDAEQKAMKEKPYFELSDEKRLEVMTQWKKTNSSTVEMTPVMFQTLGRIVSKGGDDESALSLRRRKKELQEATGTTTMEMRPTRASVAFHADSTLNSGGGKVTGKRKKATIARPAISNPWSLEEMMQLVKAWGAAVELICESSTDEPMSIVHEMYRQFKILQGGNVTRNLSSLVTRRRVLKQSYSRIVAFDKIQEMNGDPKFTELSTTTRQNLIRSWKNANLLDLSTEMYAELTKVIPLDNRAVELEDLRRPKAINTSNAGGGRSGRKLGRQLKRQKFTKATHEGNDEETGSVLSSQPPSVAGDSEEEKADMPRTVVQSRSESNSDTKTGDVGANLLTEQNPARIRPESALTKRSSSISTGDNSSSMLAGTLDVGDLSTTATTDNDDKAATFTRKRFAQSDVPIFLPAHIGGTADEVEDHDIMKLGHGAEALKPTRKSTQVSTTDKSVVSVIDHIQNEDSMDTAIPMNDSMNIGKAAKRKRRIPADGPNGHLWENKELQILIDAWEKAATLVCDSDPAERLSLNKEMYREFVEMQGGSSVRNSTALAARRSSLKFSYAHIQSFNESQKARGEPPYHDIPEDTRMAVLRSWKNRNSVDLTKAMYDGLGRIFAMNEKLSKVRSLRPPPLPKLKTNAKSHKEIKDSTLQIEANHASKTAKWTTEESSDLIKACADVMNVPSDKEQSPTEREALIYDAFVIRRQHAGDNDTPVRRDLRSMAQQWRHILASYSYIKACNDNRLEGEGPSWFDMPAPQKRAYQQCTNVPLKFVDLDAEMFALVTKTSFIGAVAPPLSSPVAKGAPEGVALRPRSTRKKTEAFWSSDSESSVSSMPTSSAKHAGRKEWTIPAVKKKNNWPAEEIWNLIRAWDEVSRMGKSSKLTSALDETFALFTKLQEGPLNRHRTLNSVRNKMIALKSSFVSISNFIGERGDITAWFDMTAEQRLVAIRSWKNKTIMDITKDMFNALEQILLRKKGEAQELSERRKPGRLKVSPARSDTKDTKVQDIKGHTGHKPEKYVAANWSKEELLMLGEACGELLEGRRSRRYVFEEEKDRFYRRYEELGGANSLTAAVGLARFVLDSYEFIYFYNQKAAETNCFLWFELDVVDREPIIAKMGKTYRSFNGLSTVDEEIYDVIDSIDAELRVKLGETKKKTYKPPNDAASSRYVDIEAVVEQCDFKKRKSLAPKKANVRELPVQFEDSSDGEADLSSSESSASEASADSDSSASIAMASRQATRSDVGRPARPSRSRVARGLNTIRTQVALSRKRRREAGSDGSSTFCITEIIQKQNCKLEEAVKRFRKDSIDARKEHHAFLVRKIQDSFPVDSGNGSYLERVAERQGQTLVDIFQRLQQQRDAEKAKDDELVHQLFGRSSLT